MGPRLPRRTFARMGNLGPVPFFARHRRGGGPCVPWVGGVWGRCERRVKGRKNRLKVNLKVEVRGRGSTGGIPSLLQTQHIVFSNICSGVFYSILGVEWWGGVGEGVGKGVEKWGGSPYY